jgi:hypothetical protein
MPMSFTQPGDRECYERDHQDFEKDLHGGSGVATTGEWSREQTRLCEAGSGG